MEKATLENPVSASIAEALLKLKKEEGDVDLLDIAKKISAKKFGKK